MKQILALTTLLLLASTLKAELIFDIQLSETTVTLGSNITVTVRIRSPSEVTVGGYTANVLAGLGDGSGGALVDGVIDLSVGDPTESWDTASIVGQAFVTTDTNNGTGTGTVLLANQVYVLGRLTLDTSGSSLGIHQLSMDSLAGNNLSGGFLAGAEFGARFDPVTSVLQYTVTAVPEPSSLLLISTAVGGALSLRLRRCSGTRVN